VKAARFLLEDQGFDEIVVEDFLEGEEVLLLAFCDKGMPAAQVCNVSSPSLCLSPSQSAFQQTYRASVTSRPAHQQLPEVCCMHATAGSSPSVARRSAPLLTPSRREQRRLV
jgi:hypothetical protein